MEGVVNGDAQPLEVRPSPPGLPVEFGEPEHSNVGSAFPPTTDLGFSTGDALGGSILLSMGRQVNAPFGAFLCLDL